jgi:hypothetical protein
LADIWQLGDHRLLCGDARKPATVNQLMGRHRAANVAAELASTPDAKATAVSLSD